MRVTLLGCGSSGGTPLIGCQCRVCLSDNPKNKRTRASVLVDIGKRRFLIDTSPDLREQALANKLNRVDAVLYTHSHADHANGIDDMRSFNFLSGDAIPAYGDEATLKDLKERFPYVFLPKPDNVWFRPCLTLNPLPQKPVQTVSILGAPVTVFEQRHGKTNTLGYRFGNIAYSTDVDEFSEPALEALAGLDVWIVDCLRYTASYSHSDFRRTLGWIEQIRPKKTVLTHMAHDFDYDKLASELPEGVVPGYDGMVIEA
jgi:phosphoribosyl 1,2-cyclic phosphate phosphodiesterase